MLILNFFHHAQNMRQCLDVLNGKLSRREDHPEMTRGAVNLQVCTGLLPFDNISDAKTI